MDIKIIEVKFEYQKRLVTIKSEPYKTIKELKEKAIKIFHNIPKDIHCFYLARDLESYENNIIGELFANREKVTLRLMPPKKQVFPIKKKLVERNEEKLFSEIYLNTNVYSSGFNNIGRFQNKKVKGSNSKSKGSNSKSRKGNSFETKKRNKEDLKLPPINALEKKDNIINERYNNINLILNLDESTEENDNKCQNCNDNNFSEYCRNCKEFLCINCKYNDKHYNHLFIHLNSNYESNIKIYGNILLTDIEYFKTNNNTINTNENIINNCTSILNINELNERQNMLINKLKDILNMYESIINQIKNELIIEGENKIKDVISIYEIESIKINNEINHLFKQLEKYKDKMNIKEFKFFFKQMSENEEKLNKINKNVIKFHLTSEINNKICSMLNKIDQAVNETIIKDHANPFNLPHKFNEELKIILNKNKKNDDDNETKKIHKRSKTLKLKKFQEENIDIS